MIDLSDVVRQLKHERAQAAKQVETLDAALAALNGSHGVRTLRRSRLSAAARARIAAAQRARWAKVRNSGELTANKPGSKKPTKLSRTARKKIAEAQRARWAKFRAARKKKAAA